MDVVDISKEVFELADFYSGTNYSNPLRDSRVHPIVQDGRFFLQASPRQYDIISGEPPPPRVAGAVNLYTQEFFSLMSSRLKPGGIATFWLPLDQLTVTDAKVILRAFHNAFPNSSVWASADPEWIMMGIKGTPHSISEAELGHLWRDTNAGADLARIGVEVPEQLAALFLMDGGEIERITHDTNPLTDFYPKRLSDITAADKSIHDFAATYIQASRAAERFRLSPLIQQIWPNVSEKSLEPFFVIREMRYRVSVGEINWLTELDLHLRGSRLKEPVLEALGTNWLRAALTEKAAHDLSSPPVELLPDLIAVALARRDFQAAIQLLEEERARRAAIGEEVCLLTYLYCLNGNVDKAESIAPETVEPNRQFVQWLWGKLQAEYGFRPPRRS